MQAPFDEARDMNRNIKDVCPEDFIADLESESPNLNGDASASSWITLSISPPPSRRKR